MPRVIEIIESMEYRGKGTTEDPCRLVRVHYTLEGEWLAEHDPHPPLDLTEYNKVPEN